MSARRDRRRCDLRRPGAGLVTGLLAVAALATAASPRDPQAALREGNRLFRDGQIEAAVEVYLEGYLPSASHPTLLYNLGTALHHLDRLPEAVLWYRRAAGAGDRSQLWRAAEPPERLHSDPWLQENLWLARRSLGSQSLPPGGSLGWLCRHTAGLRAAALALAWVTLLAVVLRETMPVWAVAAAAVVAVAIYGGAAAVEHWGPQPAVVLEDCPTPAGELPAGTEVWVRPAAGGWRIPGDPDLVCPPQAVALVFPPR
jgi:hypothetical protein